MAVSHPTMALSGQPMLSDDMLSQVNIEIRDLQRAIDLLRCSINEKEFAMKIAQTRLDERTRRLCVEVCFDEPMKGSVSLSVCIFRWEHRLFT